MRGRGAGEEKELAPFLTRPFKRLSSRLSSRGLIRLLLVPGKAGSRIRDQLKIYQINYLYVTEGFLEKPDQGSRIKDHDS